MKFNNVRRGMKREMNDIETVHAILDAGFICHVAFQHEGQPMIIPTAYGRSGNYLYLHGSTQNFMLRQMVNGQTACISITHVDGIVLAKSLFHTSVNYRSVVLFGKAEIVVDDEERIFGMKSITENIVKGRWDEVSIGTKQQLNATMVVKFTIDSASAKVRNEGCVGDDDIMDTVWSGVIPLKQQALQPIQDEKVGVQLPISESVRNFWNNHK